MDAEKPAENLDLDLGLSQHHHHLLPATELCWDVTAERVASMILGLFHISKIRFKVVYFLFAAAECETVLISGHDLLSDSGSCLMMSLPAERHHFLINDITSGP